jgi:hypothetical protein
MVEDWSYTVPTRDVMARKGWVFEDVEIQNGNLL